MDHPAAALMREVEAERAIAATPEAIALIDSIYQAISAYWDYLDRKGLIHDRECDLLRASALCITYDLCRDLDINLKDGAVDRRFNCGEDPDPFYRRANPTWPPPPK